MPPIFATSTFAHGNPLGFDYTRSGNPNFRILESVLSSLEDCKFSTVFNSGVSAITAIASSLKEGDLETTKQLLGRAYNFRGLVTPGKAIGRKIGWPTANIQVDGRKFLPGLGVYAAWAWTYLKNTPFASVMNLGPQPTVDPSSPSAVEVHLLNQNIDLTGEELLVEPVKKLRGQKRFASLEELSEQIGLDAKAAKSILQSA